MPTTDVNRTIGERARRSRARSRASRPRRTATRTARGGRRTTRSARSSSRSAEARRPPTISSASPVVCRAIASRSSGLEATCRRALCISSLASTLSVSSSVCGLRKASVTRRSSSPLAASSAAMRSRTRWRTSERASSSGSDPASARSMTRAISGADRTSSTASSIGPRQARAAARAGKKTARPAASARPGLALVRSLAALHDAVAPGVFADACPYPGLPTGCSATSGLRCRRPSTPAAADVLPRWS